MKNNFFIREFVSVAQISQLLERHGDFYDRFWQMDLFRGYCGMG